MTGSPPFAKTIGVLAVAAFCCLGRVRTPRRGDHSHMTADEIIGEGGQSIVVAIGPTVLDRRILAPDIAGFAQALTESGYAGGECYSRRAVEGTNHRHRRLLRARCERPSSHAAEQSDELATPHSITSSACCRNGSGIVRPSAFAVLRLTTSSNLLASCTGRSPGLVPFRMRST